MEERREPDGKENRKENRQIGGKSGPLELLLYEIRLTQDLFKSFSCESVVRY